MFLFKTDFRKDILLLFIITILLGVVLVLSGGYLTDNYFANMVSGLIGEYGEYDLLFTLSSDKEEIALDQIKTIAADTLPGSQFKTGPKVAGSSNYLLKLPEKYKTEEVYINLGKYFADIPGLMSKTIMTEPRLSVRGFRGSTRSVLRPLIEKIEGIAFLYPTGDGLDIIVRKPELVPEVKKELNELLSEYQILEIRYPLNQNPEELPELQQAIYQLIKDDASQIIDVTQNNDAGRVSLLTSLKQMKTFLLSYATKVSIPTASSETMPVGSRLLGISAAGNYFELEVIDNKEGQLVALIQKGEQAEEPLQELTVYYTDYRGSVGEELGVGIINNPREDLATALDKLSEITPSLAGFMAQSEQLVDFSGRIADDLANINQGLAQMEDTSQKLRNSLEEWQQEGLSVFLGEILVILDEIKNNIGDITGIQKELIQTSNRLKEGAGLIEEKLAFVPRNNSIYQQLNDLKLLFLEIANGLDENYDLVSQRLNNMGPVLNSIDGWKDKINSLLRVEESLSSGADWQLVEGIIDEINQTARAIDTSQLQEKLLSIQELLVELQTDQLPVVLSQLTYIQESLPDLKEDEIVETINLIDSYIAGQVIPGDQIQLLIKGNYDSQEVIGKIKGVVNNPAVTYIEMDAGVLQPNTRGEIFNVLSQVRAVISTIIAFIFTVLVMILDQTLIISILRLNRGNGYLYGFFSGGLIFSLICLLSQINFPYLNFQMEFIIGGVTGLLIALLSRMLNPVNEEEWEAGKALGFSPAEIMQEIIIPAGKPGLLYLLNIPKVIFR